MVNYSAQSGNQVFQALSDPTRRTMVERLARRPMSISELAEPFDISAPAVSKHVRVLENAQLISREIHGRVHICRLRGEALAVAISWMDEQRRFWEQSLDRLERYFQRRNDGGKRHGKRRTRKP
jgi:DNA-binding transcriptional ArsR family regulator